MAEDRSLTRFHAVKKEIKSQKERGAVPSIGKTTAKVDEEYAERLREANSFAQGMVAGWNAAPQDDLEALAARFERNADDWRAIGGNPDLAASRGMGFSTGMAEAWRLAADEIRRVLRRDPDYYDMDSSETSAAPQEATYDSEGDML